MLSHPDYLDMLQHTAANEEMTAQKRQKTPKSREVSRVCCLRVEFCNCAKRLPVAGPSDRMCAHNGAFCQSLCGHAASTISPLWGSNPRPYAYGAHALPTELRRQVRLCAERRYLCCGHECRFTTLRQQFPTMTSGASPETALRQKLLGGFCAGDRAARSCRAADGLPPAVSSRGCLGCVRVASPSPPQPSADSSPQPCGMSLLPLRAILAP